MSTFDTEFNEFHTLSVEETAQFLHSDHHKGLDESLAKERLHLYGDNSLGDDTKIDYKAMVIHQICNAMILVLIISMIISFAIHDWITGGVITFVIAVNVVIGIFQEYKASKTMNSLKQLSSPNAHVFRDGGKSNIIPSKDVVPGDIVLVKVGDTVPADIRLFNCNNFETDEALLTGESLPVSKDDKIVYGKNEYTSVGDRLNLAYSSSIVVKGRAHGIVVRTGLNTEIGKIAKSLQGKDDLISRDPSKSWWKNVYITLKQTTGAFLGTTIGTPLHRKLSKLAILLFGVAVIFAIVVMASQSFKVDRGIAIYAICVALSMIPSSLVVVLTITMSVGATVMAARHVIIRKLDSLEALGAVNDICSDKTGTLTQGKMITRRVWIPGFGTIMVDNSNEPFNPTVGDINFIPRVSPQEYKNDDSQDVGILQNFKERYYQNELPQDIDHKLFQKWVHAASLANIANVFQDKETGDWVAHGDPTEIAIQVFATKLDVPRRKLTGEKVPDGSDVVEETLEEDEKEESKELTPISKNNNSPFKHIAEFPFDSTIKRMSAVYESCETEETIVYTKGAFESVIGCCNYWYGNSSNDLLKLTDTDKKFISKNIDTLSQEGLRVLVFATKSYDNNTLSPEDKQKVLKDRPFVEDGLTFIGLIGIYDPPRQETAGAVKKFHQAGINVHMLTGDFPGTAKAIAQEVGILPVNLYHYPKDVVDVMVMTGSQFDDLSDDEIDAMPVLPLVIARCSPQTKVRMIEALHRREKFCAMTGDGVNDSPSLKMANVGIAMGINGSDVAKDASDIVLSDDNFASILNAVEEGRRMSDNIQKFVLQLLAENVAQALYLIIGLAFQDEQSKSVFPLSPVEVLWVIVVTSCFPAMGLGLEKAAPDLMERPPNSSKDGIFTWEIIVDMFSYGLLMAASCMGTFTVIIYGRDNGQLGYECNKRFSDACHYVFRARSGAFATMTWCALILAWEVVDLRRSFFRMQPETDEPVRQFFRDIYGNKFLFWSIMFGFASAFPVVYIPVINDKVFLHKGIGYEWGVAISFTVIFWISCEIYKWGKRLYYKNKSRAENPENDLEKSVSRDPFHAYSSSTTLEASIIIQPKV